MTLRQKITIIITALFSASMLIGIYFSAVTAISGFAFALSQFEMYWYFLVSLALGFAIQVGLYMYLRQLVRNSAMNMPGNTVAVTGTTSTLAMISCCAHYLANIVPILGIAGALTVVAQYQVEIFWIGLLFNFFGIIFILNKVISFKKHLL